MDLIKLAEALAIFIKVLFTKKKFSKSLGDNILIREICKEIVINGKMSVDCMLLVMAENGKGKHLYKKWSIIEGYHNDFTMPHFDYGNYRDVIMDFDHMQLMQRICEQKIFGFASNEIKGESLKTAYAFELVLYTQFFLIKESKHYMYYLVAGTTANNEKLNTQHQTNQFRFAINKITNIVSKY